MSSFEKSKTESPVQAIATRGDHHAILVGVSEHHCYATASSQPNLLSLKPGRFSISAYRNFVLLTIHAGATLQPLHREQFQLGSLHSDTATVQTYRVPTLPDIKKSISEEVRPDHSEPLLIRDN
jgi:hypothetical protein